MISRHLVFTWTQFLVVEFQTSDFSASDRRLGERRIFYLRDDAKRANKDSTTDLEGIVLDDVAENPGTGSRGQQLH
jgi:hypothetical protein